MLENELFMRVIDNAISFEDFKARLATGRPLRIKYGVDVTAPFLHLGHAVNLWAMRQMQEVGHKVVFLIGDFTTMIGDPSGKSQARPVITRDEIDANAFKFIEQVTTVLLTDPAVFEVRRNSEWFDRMPLTKFLHLLARVTHARLIERDMFQKRIADETEIHMHELLYPILQGYDSVMLQSDLTIVGSDQLFNEKMGRHYQDLAGQKPQVILTTKITPGTDGRNKQSKSLNNYIALADTPRDKFGKLMSLPDTLIHDFLTVYTALSNADVAALAARIPHEPMAVKRAMARAIVARYHGDAVAAAEVDYFERVFSRRERPTENLPVVSIPTALTVLDTIRRVLPDHSGTECRRLIAQNAVEMNGERLNDPARTLTLPRGGAVLRVGKLRHVRVVTSDEPEKGVPSE